MKGCFSGNLTINISGFSGNFPRKFPYHLFPFLSFWNFWLNNSTQSCLEGKERNQNNKWQTFCLLLSVTDFHATLHAKESARDQDRRERFTTHFYQDFQQDCVLPVVKQSARNHVINLQDNDSILTSAEITAAMNAKNYCLKQRGVYQGRR